MRLRLRSNLFVRSLEDRTAPAVFTVMNNGDAGAGSLRDCLAQANGSPGADTITFKSGMVGSIVLASQIAINDDVTIQGPGSKILTVSGNASTRIFNTTGAQSGDEINISGLTLAVGKVTLESGAAIYSLSQKLTLTDCALVGNQAAFGGAVLVAGGTLTAIDCTFASNYAGDNIGAVAVYGTGSKLILRRCSISGNTANGFVGAVYATNYLLIDSSTLSGNSAGAGGGGALSLSGAFQPGALTIRNSTISDNKAGTSYGGGGIFAFDFTGVLHLQNSTITNNTTPLDGGGFRRQFGTGTMLVESSIIAQNSSFYGTRDLSFDAPTTVIASNSIFGVADKGNATLTGVGNQFGTLASPLDAKLSPLTDFGGPVLTHHPLAGSPAIDKGSNSLGLATDGRGQPRVFNGVADVGAFEINPAKFAVSVFVDVNNGNFQPNDLSLREALQLANASAVSHDTVTFTYTLSPTVLTAGELAINTALTIDGTGMGNSISGNKASRIFNLSKAPAGSPINIYGMYLSGGNAAPFIQGGAIYGAGQALTLRQCVLTDNQAKYGAAIHFSYGGTVTAEDTVFSNNVATAIGGAIDMLFAGPLDLRRCTIAGNQAGLGGAIYSSGQFLLDSCAVTGNKATQTGGGGLYLQSTFPADGAIIRNTTISGNSAETFGGGINANFSGTLLIQNSTITANTSKNNGGGIARVAGDGVVQLESSIVAQNSSASGTPDVFFDAPTTLSSTASLIGVADKGNFSISGTGNQSGTLAKPLDAKLSVLGEFGGPTKTHLPMTGSPAIDKGANLANLTMDQRGLSRVVNATTDIGAVELQLNMFVVDIVADESDGNYAAGDLSLREAILLADAIPTIADKITFSPTVFGKTPQTITLTLGEILPSSPIDIVGPGAGLLTITTNKLSRAFNLLNSAEGTVFSISGLTLANCGDAGKNGGALFIEDEVVTLADCVLTGNTANVGGVAQVYRGSLTVNRCVITGNQANQSFGAGGAFAVRQQPGGTLTVRDSTLTGNTAGSCGAIFFYSTGGTLLIENSTLSANSATTSGAGAVGINAGFSVIRNSTLSGNQAKTVGGAVGLAPFRGVTFQNCTLTLNSAAEGGGVGGGAGAGVLLESTIVSGNTATAAGPDFSVNTVQATTSLIGSKNGVNSFTGDAVTNTLLGKAPLLGPLANNGGLTQTHALLSGSPAIDAGSNPATLPFDQRGPGFLRQVKSGVDIGAFEVPLPPARIAFLQVNEGAVQRSRVTSLTVTFDQTVALPTNPADAFDLKRQDNAQVTCVASINGNTVTLTFTDGALNFGSLSDGRYTLTAFASKIPNLDGNGDGTPGDDYVLVGTPANGLFRLFGDADGNGTVNTADFNAFRAAFGGSSSIFDFDNAGGVSTLDFNQFRTRFGSSV